MSMSIILSEFITDDDKLSVNYKELSKEVVVTEFINDFLSPLISSFDAYEFEEKVTYKELDKKCVYKLSQTINNKLAEELNEIELKSDIKDCLNHLKDLVEINTIVTEYLNKIIESKNIIKILVV